MFSNVLTIAVIVVLAGFLLFYLRKQPRPVPHATVCECIAINVPLRAAYDRWTMFKEFPLFMENVQHVQQLDHQRLHWHAELQDEPIEWEARIIRQIPDKCIAWESTSGAPHSVAVSFRRLSSSRTRIKYELHHAASVPADGILQRSYHIRRDLKRCKEVLESGGRPVPARA